MLVTELCWESLVEVQLFEPLAREASCDLLVIELPTREEGAFATCF